MKSNLVRVSILVLGAAGAAFAQTPHTVRADIPFDFAVAGETMPAGHYEIDTRSAAMIVVRGANSGRTAIVNTADARTLDRQQEARLVFHRYGDQYFLHQVWTTDLNAGRELPQTRKERSLAKGPSNAKRVVIAASR